MVGSCSSTLQPSIPRLVLMRQKGNGFCVESPEANNGTTSLVINHAVAWLCAYMTRGQGRSGKGPIPLTWTLTPGDPMDLNEEVPHICSSRVTNQIMLMARDSTQYNRIHLVSLHSIVPLSGHQWGPGQISDPLLFSIYFSPPK